VEWIYYQNNTRRSFKMRLRIIKLSWLCVAAVIVVGMVAAGAFAQDGKVSVQGKVTVFTPSKPSNPAAVDLRNAKSMDLPNPGYIAPEIFEGAASVGSLGTPGFSPGARGNGKMSLMTLPMSVEDVISEAEGIEPQEYGTFNQPYLPYTTSRVDLYSIFPTAWYPYASAGKLYFQKPDNSWWVCSASLIKRGVIVTAAHCVANFGKQQFYKNWVFYPAHTVNALWAIAPYGTWSTAGAWVMTSYFNGTDPCAVAGVVCQDDVAVLRVAAQGTAAAPIYPGTYTGWFGYGWNLWGFTPSKTALINQLGYPVSHDGGLRMQRTDSQGFVSTMQNNTVWGSRQTGGSSGGPELVNLGVAAALSGTAYGTYSSYDIVVGVTSWGYTSDAVKAEGASPFTSGNIVPLVNAACGGSPPTFAGCK